jgi:hypothetical protein
MNKFFNSIIFFRFIRQLYIVFFLIILTSSSHSQTINYNWQNLFEQSYYGTYKGFAPLKGDWLKLSKSNRVTDLQPLSYGLDAILAMYETTDSVSYLEDAMVLTNNIISGAQETKHISGNRYQLKDSYKGWIENGNDSSSGVFHTETVLSEIYFFQYVSRLLKDIHKDNSINQIKRFKVFYNKTLDFIETNIWDKWVTRGVRFDNNKYNYLLLSRMHMASHWAYIAAELSFLTTSESRRIAYLDFVNDYNNKLENNFYKYDKYILWNQTWDRTTYASGMIQDVSHANLVVSYLVEAYDLGLWKDFDAIQRIINTLKDKLWDPQDCLFRDNIDGTIFKPGLAHSSIGSFQADGFVKLTRYDISLFSIYAKFVSCSRYLTAWQQYGQLFANLALSEKLLSNPSLK